MTLYFYKSRVVGNYYDLPTFFNIGTYARVKNVNKKLSLNIKADDSIILKIPAPIALPDNTLITEYTHVLVEETDKVYIITSFDYINENQRYLNLEDDPILSNYNALRNSNIALSRTNDPVKFTGLLDVKDTILERKVAQSNYIIPSRRLGKWALIMVQNEVISLAETRIGIKFGPAKDNETGWIVEETFSSFGALTAKYPEISISSSAGAIQPIAVEYYQKIVQVGTTMTPFNYVMYQCVWYNNALKWIQLPTSFFEGNSVVLYVSRSQMLPYKTSEAEASMCLIAIPFEYMRVKNSAGTYTELYPFRFFNGLTDATVVYDIKIIDDLLIPDQNISYGTNFEKRLEINVGTPFRCVPTFTTASTGTATKNGDLAYLTKINNTIDITPSYFKTYYFSASYLSVRYLYVEPFVNYYLYIYGQRISVPGRVVWDATSVHLKIILNSDGISYIVYKNNDINSTFATGSLTSTVKYQVDKLDQFYATNPTYKDQFNTSQNQRLTKAILNASTGVLTSAATGNAVGLIGVGASAINSGLDMGFAAKNDELMRKGLSGQSDDMYGNPSELNVLLLSRFGVYWYSMEENKTSRYTNINNLKIELFTRGFPTASTIKISNINVGLTINPIATTNTDGDVNLVNGQIIYGSLMQTIKNTFETNRINKKLNEGIIITYTTL